MRTSISRLLRLVFALGLAAISTVGARAAESTQRMSEAEKNSFVYRLTITDRVRISVFQEEDLAEIVRVDARGNINLKLVGDLRVAGLTVNEAQRAIEQAYRDGRFLRNPQATISIEDYALREVSIQGQVKAPGRYVLPIESTFSAVELVTKAGGLTDIAKGSAVVITRITADGKKHTFNVDVEGAIRGRKGKTAENSSLPLEPGDIVYVPERII